MGDSDPNTRHSAQAPAGSPGRVAPASGFALRHTLAALQHRNYRLFFFGAILVAMMLLRPQGLMGSPRHKLEMETPA